MSEAEKRRIEASEGDPNGWRHWGPYLSERAWGTVREDYSADGDSWGYFPHDHARSRAYRWSEDGLGGICDIRQVLCFSLSLWNGQDALLKERLFGLTGKEGNHGEDVKECYYYLDSTPTHSYLKFLYKYPQAAFPYEKLVEENRRRSRHEWEYELRDTGVFAENRYFDVFVEYAKATPEDILIRITAHNRGPEAAPLHLLPTLWFRNTWAWGGSGSVVPRPSLTQDSGDPPPGTRVLNAAHYRLGQKRLYAQGEPVLLFTENETNHRRLHDAPNPTPFVKDGIHDHVVHAAVGAVNPANTGTRAAAWYAFPEVPPGCAATLCLRLTDQVFASEEAAFGPAAFDAVFDARIAEADEFYAGLAPPSVSDDARRVQRQAFAGLLWSKQFYHFDVSRWLDGDAEGPPPSPERRRGRNGTWQTIAVADVLSMPDAWEYPWFAAWDLAFHMIPFAQIDPDFAKHQLLLMCREWYMHPNGQLPAYEWNFSDVNPPVHAWAALRVYKIERKMQGKKRDEPGDVAFLERIFHKLLLNFTWWVNRKDRQGSNVFEGGFLGLDNIGVFDRSAPLPTGGHIEQCDGTAWMGMFCLNMLAIALELAKVEPAYQDVATKFAEHFVYIAHALTNIGEDGLAMWDEEDGFFYDVLHLPEEDGAKGEKYLPLRIRSIVGLIPLFAVEAFDTTALAAAPDFLKRMDWFLRHKPDLARDVAHITDRGQQERALFSIVDRDRLRRILRRVLDETEFLSPHGIRSLSRWHRERPYTLKGEDDALYRVDYQPAESTSSMFGGNSNWRGPIWFPINYLLIEALQKYDYVYGGTFTIEFPTGSGNELTLWDVAAELSRRLSHLFLQDANGRRPAHGGADDLLQHDPHWRDHILFYEYFHGDNGAGLGASHQTGWTALVAKLIAQSGE